MSRIRALLVAEAANPEWVSVPLVGWSHAMALRELVDGHLVTQVRNREAILRAGLKEDADFTAIDSEAIARPLWRAASLLRGGAGKGWTTVAAISAVSYYHFEHLLWKKFGERIRRGEFDIVHRITPLSPTTPSLLARKCAKANVPFVLGPLNGGVPWPQWFQAERRKEKEWLAPLRNAYKALPGYGSTLKHSAAIIAGSRYTMSQIPRRYDDKVHYIAENAIDPARFTMSHSRVAQLPLKLLFVGRLVPYKGADMAIEAASPLLKEGLATLTIVGDGPERESLEQLAAQLAPPGSVQFAGQVPHDQVQRHFAEADLFTFPSIREFGGAVILEAMAMGCIPAAIDYGGPSELMTAESAFPIPIGPRENIVENLRSILRQAASQPDRLAPISACGIERAKGEFTWRAKAITVVDIYRSVLQSRKPSASTHN